MSESIRETCQTAIRELLAAARLHRGDIVVIGCSSSEVLGEKIGTHSSYETAEEIHGRHRSGPGGRRTVAGSAVL